MSILDNIVRPFWLAGLNQISGSQRKGLGGLICDENYQIYSQMSPTTFVLSFSDADAFLDAFAGDISRIGSASFESVIGIRKSRALPKSSAWLVVQTYYSAFFAGHALLRLLGESCTPLEREQVKSLERMGKLFGTAPASPLSGGLYHFICNTSARTISGTALSGGSHEVFWRVFHDRMMRLANDALTVSTESAANLQLASTKLSELVDNLSFQSSPRGSWLSSVRNGVNYNQKLATWYPYSGQQKYYAQLFDKVEEWADDPLDLDLSSWGDKDVRRFQVTCNFIIATLRSLINDMAARCTSGRSFHDFGALACLKIATRNQT
jgi:hypothetical protein